MRSKVMASLLYRARPPAWRRSPTVVIRRARVPMPSRKKRTTRLLKRTIKPTSEPGWRQWAELVDEFNRFFVFSDTQKMYSS